ncbi:recQ-mediated genome instability protein 1 [Spea bombifrons]|uniref:recQ-mediated genome instability protein 1 n=1 Tax=Spea bombifrons TaxID=233779 RepID=UPI00234A678F|nr:recQ-mediated genome instability protein 1 [Spea bombifrons]XP_053323077.1 recQ-mediated genome instability protein 1 [Spea bombifrons]
MMNTPASALRAKTWLSSTWHVKVPDQWLEACISWIQEENHGSSLSQAEINKQVFEQWLLTDLRDLQCPILPAGIVQSLKCELNGYYAIQIDSLVDVSLPAYSQLQKLRGRENTNEHVTATTQASQKPWEAKPTRMLMLQLTDGTQQIQGMEYQPVPTLNAYLSPGTKILLQGTIVCRLGVLLLKSENVKVLGGEVEALIAEYTQDKVLSRLIGAEDNPLPESSNAQEQRLRGIDEVGQNLGPSDEDLLASLDDNVEFTINNGSIPESGYISRSEVSSISYLESQQVQHSHARQASFPQSNQTVQASARDDLAEEYDLDDDLFLEEEIQRELEEMSMDQPPRGNQNLPIERPPQETAASQIQPKKITLDDRLYNPPFTYLSLMLASKSRDKKIVKLKSFIVTLNGNLSMSSGNWSIKAKISDGTAYLDVNFSDGVLTKLIGFSVPEMKKLKKDSTQQQKIMAGLQKCQMELTDFCGIMTISYDPTNSEASVLALQDVTEDVLRSLKRRLNM